MAMVIAMATAVTVSMAIVMAMVATKDVSLAVATFYST